MTVTRTAALGLAVLAGFAALVIRVPGQASAATAYRYWAFYLGNGASWQYAPRGPATEYPVDGDVEGWRSAIQADAANGLLPRAAPDFTTLCASSPPEAGELRVGIVIDFGVATDAPPDERPPAGVVPGCVYVHNGQTDMDVLAAAATIRIGTGSYVGLVCGIDGYPKTECAVAATIHPATPTPAPTPATSTHTPTPTTHPVATKPAPTRPSPAASLAVAAPSPAGPSAAEQAGSSAPAQGFAPAQSSAPAPSAPAQSSAPPQSAAATALSLPALRSNSRHRDDIPAATIAGISVIVILGAGAVWRARVRGR